MMNNQIEPNELRDSVRHVLEKNANRRAPYSGKPGDGTALWDIIAELGWMLLTTPVELDGLGQSFVTLIPIYEELGRVVSSLPFAGSMAGIDVLLSSVGGVLRGFNAPGNPSIKIIVFCESAEAGRCRIACAH